MKKQCNILILLLVVVVTLAGCQSPFYEFGLLVCGSYAVPGMFCAEMKGETFEITVMETDPQGRVLFSYTTSHLFTGQEETAYVICQVKEETYIDYYEDIAYCFSEKNIPELKIQNDWGKRLVPSKMSRRQVLMLNPPSIGMEKIPYDYSNIKNFFAAAVKAAGAELHYQVCFDVNPSGQSLYWVSAIENGEERFYIGFLEVDGTVELLPAAEEIIDTGALAEFKRVCGWNYDIMD